MTSSHQDASSCQWFSQLAGALDRRSAGRLALLFLGALLARGRRTVTSWIRAAGLSQKYQCCYTTVAAGGKRAEEIAARLITRVVKPLIAGLPRITLALDDTPTQRYGPFVQGAGIHHNPTPGPANAPHVYGHIWVVLGLLAIHPAWGRVRVGKHWCIPRLPLDVHADRGVGVASIAGRIGGPPGLAMGRSQSAPESCGQASRVAARIAGRANSRGSTPRGHRS